MPISRKYSESASAFSIVSHSDGVTARPVLSRKIHTDLRRYQGAREAMQGGLYRRRKVAVHRVAV
jgi:hypothetical protein